MNKKIYSAPYVKMVEMKGDIISTSNGDEIQTMSIHDTYRENAEDL